MPTKLTNEVLSAAIEGFEEQKRRIDQQIAELRALLPGTKARNSGGGAGRQRRSMSPAARARIAAAQRKRWASFKKESGTAAKAAPARKRRRLSAAGRKAIIEATKRRWEAFRKARAK